MAAQFVENVTEQAKLCIEERTTFAGFLLTPLFSGMIVAYLTRNDVIGWYQRVNKPSFTPPDYAFGPVWTVLYLMMGYAAFLVYEATKVTSTIPVLCIILFVLQFVLNQTFSLLFFKARRWDLSMIDLAVLWLCIPACIAAFLKVNTQAGFLLFPYWAFVSYAAVLNFAFIRENPNLESDLKKSDKTEKVEEKMS
mmetsp:Transcript_9310/g.16767  ORF Transcript_9310/g.16767 Transcript_9310/m.16767 type:complete len:195 (-) Transcript_9310:1864-2448(-)